jgi:anhydro-N-acetylmuramic acid kinase
MNKRRLKFVGPGSLSRWTIGLVVSPGGGRLDGAAIAGYGKGVDLRAEAHASDSIMIPQDTVDLLSQTIRGSGGFSMESLIRLREELGEVQAELIARLPQKAGISPSRIVAVSVHDPGCWFGSSGSPGYIGLCDPARLAELTGMNIIDAFAARDLAARGQGGPISALAKWFLLKDRKKNRALLDLGHTIELGFFPADSDSMASGRVLAFEVGPGMRLLDHLARQLTGNEHDFDPGGRLAVQGRKIEPLLEHWLADSYFDRPLPRWSPRGVQPERFLNEAVQMAVDNDWSVRDLLCTATHLLAESIALALRRCLPEEDSIDELILTGGGRHNGMLLRELSARVPDIKLLGCDELGFSEREIEPSAVALLAHFYLDQIPGNSTSITGTDLPRVLGRLTPGSPQNWRRLFSQLSDATPTMRPLRAAM